MHQTSRFLHDRDNQAFGLYRDSLQSRAFWAWDSGDYGVSAQVIGFPKERVAIIVLSNMGNGDAADKANQIAAF
ncbi:MAG: hypothetical protein M3O71_15930 [Bacteroidota bacterium]|nr:hypothetical protein [Bacteroidota bacterium]